VAGVRTVVWLKQFAGCGVEVLQLEVAGALQRHAEALGVPAPLPQHVLREAAGAGAHVTEVQQLPVMLPRQGPLTHAGPHFPLVLSAAFDS